jgi:hypothetical protein
MEITLSSQVTLKPTDDGALLVNRQGEAYYELDEVGTRLWQLLSANGDFEAALVQLLKEYEVEEEELRGELYELLEDMAQADLVAWE